MDAVIDNLSRPFPLTPLGTEWEMLTDRVMGGLSRGQIRREIVNGRPAIRMTGDVRTENNGGFVQMALDLVPGGGTVDARHWAGIEIEICGPPEDYNLHLRTADITRPWQSYRCVFRSGPDWQRITLPFAGFSAYRTDAPFDLRSLRRIGIVAIGRAFQADLALTSISFYP